MKHKTRRTEYRQTAPACQAEQNFNSTHPNSKIKKVKKNISTTLSLFISYIQLDSDINSSTRSIYFFRIILRYLLYFSEYLQLYKQSTHFKVHIFDTVLTSFAFTRFISPPQQTQSIKQKEQIGRGGLYILQKTKKDKEKAARFVLVQ